MSALWLGQFGGWMATGAGLLVAYLSAWGAFLTPKALWLVPIGLAWSVFGHLWVAPQEQRLTHVKEALIELPENVLQLLVNTVSFVRVGAFALAHSGLSTAVVEVAAVFESVPAQSLVLVVGNLIVILLEGLVVAVQTTRLVLFEFFIRFLRGEGRPFHPLPPPNLASNNDPRSVS